MFDGSGKLRYSRLDDGRYKLIVEVDPEIGRYYRSLIPKAYRTNPPRYAPHITIVRHEVPVLLDAWGRHEGETVAFQYSGEILRDEVYFWLNAFSEQLSQVRRGLGLPIYSHFTRPPSGEDCFHITIANTKKLHASGGPE